MSQKEYGAVSGSDWSSTYEGAFRDQPMLEIGLAGVAGAETYRAQRARGHQSLFPQKLQSLSGTLLRKKLPPTPPMSDPPTPRPTPESPSLDEYLAESRTGYSPQEAQQEFAQAPSSSPGSGFVSQMFGSVGSSKAVNEGASPKSSPRSTSSNERFEAYSDGASHKTYSGSSDSGECEYRHDYILKLTVPDLA